MAKSTGVTTTVTVQDAGAVARNLSNDILSINLDTSRNLIDVTGLDKSAIERLPLLSDGKLAITGAFNPTATTGEHAVFSTIQSSAAARQVVITYNTTPAAVMTLTVLFDTYNVTRDQAGALMFSVSGQLSSGTAPAWS